MNAGHILATGTPQEILTLTGARTLEEAFIALLPQAQRDGLSRVIIPPARQTPTERSPSKADDLTMRFGDFTAVDHVSFNIGRGEIFGFLGSNGAARRPP